MPVAILPVGCFVAPARLASPWAASINAVCPMEGGGGSDELYGCVYSFKAGWMRCVGANGCCGCNSLNQLCPSLLPLFKGELQFGEQKCLCNYGVLSSCACCTQHLPPAAAPSITHQQGNRQAPSTSPAASLLFPSEPPTIGNKAPRSTPQHVLGTHQPSTAVQRVSLAFSEHSSSHGCAREGTRD